MCVESCTFMRLGKEAVFFKVFLTELQEDHKNLCCINNSNRATDSNSNLVRTHQTGNPKKHKSFFKRRSFQAFLNRRDAERFAKDMHNPYCNYRYVVRKVIAPKGALIGHGIIQQASCGVDGKPGVRISSGKVVEE